MEPGLRALRVIEGSQFADFVVVAAEEYGHGISSREESLECFSGIPEGFHILQMSQKEPGEGQAEQAPGWPGGQLGEQECLAELVGQQQSRSANEKKGIFWAAENAAEEASEGGRGGFIGEDFFVDMSPEADSGYMAEFVCEKLAALIKEPAGFFTETPPDDKQGEKIRIEIISAASEEEAISRVDKEAGDPIGFEAIEIFGEFLRFLKQGFRNTILLLDSDVFDGGTALAFEGGVQFEVFCIEESDPSREILCIFVIGAKDSACIELGERVQVTLSSL